MWQCPALYPLSRLLRLIVGQSPRASCLFPGTATVDSEARRHPLKGTPFLSVLSFQRWSLCLWLKRKPRVSLSSIPFNHMHMLYPLGIRQGGCIWRGKEAFISNLLAVIGYKKKIKLNHGCLCLICKSREGCVPCGAHMV